MRRPLLLATLLFLGCATRQAPSSPTAPTAPTAPTPTWSTASAADWAELQRQLVGDWKAPLGEDRFIRVSYRVISGGSALLETFVGPGGGATISVYHPDGAHLMLTHYCAQGNQVRLKAVAIAADQMTFRFLDATNFTGQPSMRELTVVFGADGFEQRSVYRDRQGKEAPESLHFVRDDRASTDSPAPAITG